MIFELGPFILRRVESRGTLEISLKKFYAFPCGWAYGLDDSLAFRKPALFIRVGKLVVFSLELFHPGFELWIFGFWLIK